MKTRNSALYEKLSPGDTFILARAIPTPPLKEIPTHLAQPTFQLTAPSLSATGKSNSMLNLLARSPTQRNSRRKPQNARANPRKTSANRKATHEM